MRLLAFLDLPLIDESGFVDDIVEDLRRRRTPGRPGRLKRRSSAQAPDRAARPRPSLHDEPLHGSTRVVDITRA